MEFELSSIQRYPVICIISPRCESQLINSIMSAIKTDEQAVYDYIPENATNSLVCLEDVSQEELWSWSCEKMRNIMQYNRFLSNTFIFSMKRPYIIPRGVAHMVEYYFVHHFGSEDIMMLSPYTVDLLYKYWNYVVIDANKLTEKGFSALQDLDR